MILIGKDIKWLKAVDKLSHNVILDWEGNEKITSLNREMGQIQIEGVWIGWYICQQKKQRTH